MARRMPGRQWAYDLSASQCRHSDPRTVRGFNDRLVLRSESTPENRHRQQPLHFCHWQRELGRPQGVNDVGPLRWLE